MTMKIGYFFLSLLLILGFNCSPNNGDPNDNLPPDGTLTDYDGDCISDRDEGREEERDTDRDGIPDYRDDDSDNDGHTDLVENLSSCENEDPMDHDSDGIPNYLDLDSDSNGLPDSREDESDYDEDGIPNFADDDDDGDNIPDVQEIGPDPVDPADTDGDGTPDYQDTDSDNDSILDRHEYGPDMDADGTPNAQDTDSDGDGIPDSEEAGDVFPETPPRDTDEDGVPDFRDRDSDNDGLTDAFERENREEIGSNPYDADTDDDGVTDWIEVAAGTDPTNGHDNPWSRGHFYFILPYEEPPEPAEDTLAFSTSLQLVDVFFAIDLTGSMETELLTIRSRMTEIIENVSCGPGESPEFTNCIPDLWVGFGWFTDAGEFGADNATLEVNANLTSDYEFVISQMPSSTRGGGNECQRRAAYCTIHGPGSPYCAEASTRNMDEWPCPGTEIGFPCFRPDAARTIVLLTDENMDQDINPDYDTVAEELLSAQITFIGINAEETRDPEVTADLTEIAVRTGSFDEYGAPMVFMGAESNVSETVADAIRTVSHVPIDVFARPLATEQHGINPLDFIESLTINLSDDAPCTAWGDMEDTNGDGVLDTFIELDPGTPVCWDVRARMNTIAPAQEEPQIYTATIEIRGGPGATLLDSRDIYFLVPPSTYVEPFE